MQHQQASADSTNHTKTPCISVTLKIRERRVRRREQWAKICVYLAHNVSATLQYTLSCVFVSQKALSTVCQYRINPIQSNCAGERDQANQKEVSPTHFLGTSLPSSQVSVRENLPYEGTSQLSFLISAMTGSWSRAPFPTHSGSPALGI